MAIGACRSVLDRFGKGVRGAPRDALIADSVEAEYRGRAFGFRRSMDQTGAVIGPLIGMGLLALFHDNLRWVFLIAFIPSLISTVIVLVVRERRINADSEGEASIDARRAQSSVPPFLSGRCDLLDRELIRCLSDPPCQATWLFPYNGDWSFRSLQHNVCLIGIPGRIVSDKIPRRFLFTAGLIVFALVYAGFAIINDVRWLWGLFPVYGLYMGLTDGVSRAIVSDLVDTAHRGSALGLHAAVLGFAAFPASAAAGWLWTSFGPAAPFYSGAICAGAAAMLATLIRPETGTVQATQASS